MLNSTGKRIVLLTALPFVLLPTISRAADKGTLTEAKVKDLIERDTQIQGCGDASYAFTSVQLGKPEKQKNGSTKVDVYPVHARYAVTCRYGDEKMRAEVDLKTGYYIDQFGAWQGTATGYDGDQSWDNTQSDVRCRAQNLAHYTVDANGKVTGSTPAKDQSFGFPSCNVMTKAAD